MTDHPTYLIATVTPADVRAWQIALDGGTAAEIMAVLSRTVAPGKHDRAGHPGRAGIHVRNACKRIGRDTGDDKAVTLGEASSAPWARLLAMRGSVTIALGGTVLVAVRADMLEDEGDADDMIDAIDHAKATRANVEQREIERAEARELETAPALALEPGDA